MSRVRTLLSVLCLGVAAAAQQPDAPVPASTLLSRLAARDIGPTDAGTVWTALADRTIDVRAQAFEHVRRHYGESLRTFARTQERVRQHARRAAPLLVRDRLGKTGAAEVETLRREALAASRADDLDKQRIRQAIDPKLLRLCELLVPTQEDLLAADRALADAVAALRAHFDDARAWYQLQATGLQALEEAPGGLRHLEKLQPAADPPLQGAVERELEYLCLAALPMSARDLRALEHNAALRDSGDPEEHAGTFELNRIRYALGLPLLEIDQKLAAAARDHAEDMHRLGFFSHTSPIEGKRTPGERAARAGTSGGAENIAAGQSTGRGAIEAWWYSPGHHKNMLGNHARTGLGRCEQLWTQMFGG